MEKMRNRAVAQWEADSSSYIFSDSSDHVGERTKSQLGTRVPGTKL